MKRFSAVIFLATFFLIGAKKIPENINVTISSTAGAKARVYKEMNDNGTNRQVLVVDTILPQLTELEVKISEPLLYQWVLNAQGFIINGSMPYFKTKVLSLPDSFPIDPTEKQRLLTTTFYLHVTDVDPSRIVSILFKDSLPSGVEKVPHPLPWDTYNPSGTWAHAVQKGFAVNKNVWLLTEPPRDVLDFCPRFESLTSEQRSYFWMSLIAKISYYESLFIPITASDEGRFDPGKVGVISSGLTQISLKSSQATCYQERGCAIIKNQDDLFNPDKNLRCAIGIMSCLAETADCISCKSNGRWQGIAKYWSTLQDKREVPCPTCAGGKVTIGLKKEIQEALKTEAAFCF